MNFAITIISLLNYGLTDPYIWSTREARLSNYSCKKSLTNSHEINFTTMLFSLIASFLALTIAHPTPDHPSGPVSNSAQLLEDLKPREVFPATPAYLFARELFSGRPADLDIQIWDQPNCPPRPKGNPTDFGSIINHHNYEGQPLKILSYSLNRTLDPREVLDFSNNINEVVGSLPPPPPSPTTPPPASPTVPCGEKGGG